MASDDEQIIRLYQRHARAWTQQRERQRGRLMEASWLDRFLGLLPVRRAVLDVGCGSGEPMGRYLAERGCGMTGIDSAPDMIAMWNDRLRGHASRVADMRLLCLGKRFDGILAWDSCFHLCHDDQRRMFPVFRDHAAAGAALMFTSGPAHGEAIGSLEGEALYHASLDSAEYRALLDEAGFAVVADVAEDPTCGGHTVWLARFR